MKALILTSCIFRNGMLRILLSLFFLIPLFGLQAQVAPTVKTYDPPDQITNATAEIEGTITDTGGTFILARGFCYKVYDGTDPDTSDDRSDETGGYYGKGDYDTTLTGLLSETQYSVQAYAINSAGLGYGGRIDFYTLSDEPSSQPSTFEVVKSTVSQINLSFSAPSSIANADGYLVVQSQGVAPTFQPEDGEAYYVGQTNGIQTIVAVISNTTSTSVSISNLTSGTKYYYTLYPFNFDGFNQETYNYLLTSAKVVSASTIVVPTVTTSSAIDSLSDIKAYISGSITNVGGEDADTIGIAYKLYSSSGKPDRTDLTEEKTGSFGVGTYGGTLTNLSPETHYKARTYAINSAGTGFGNVIDFYTYATEPVLHPNEFIATTNTVSQIEINYDAPASIGADGYIILKKQGSNLNANPVDGSAYTIGTSIGDASVAAIVDQNDTVSLISSVIAGKWYYFKLVPFNWDGSNYQTYNYYTSGAKKDSVQTIVSPTVNSVNIYNIDTTSAYLDLYISNTGGENADTVGAVYKVFASGDPTVQDDAVFSKGPYGIGTVSMPVSGLLTGTRYKIAAYASNSAGEAYGSTLDFYTLSSEPSEHPASFVATTVTTSQIKLDFSAPSSIYNADGYIIVQRQDSIPRGFPVDANTYSVGSSIGNGIVAAIISNSASTTAYITSVSSGNEYYFKVFPYNWDGSNSETYNYKTDGTPLVDTALTIVIPTVQTDQSIENIRQDSASVKGSVLNTGGALISSRGIAYSENPSPGILDSFVSSGGTAPFGPGSFSAVTTPLNPETRYYVRAAATNAAGTAYGSEYSFYTLSEEPTSHPDTFEAVATTTTQIDLTFSPASKILYADGYLIIQKQGSAPTAVPEDGTAYNTGSPVGDGIVASIINNTGSTSASITSVSAGNTYHFMIIPFNWDGQNAQTYNYYTASSIKRASDNTIVAPTVTTDATISYISSDSAWVKGNITSTGAGVIQYRGFSYDTNSSLHPATSLTVYESGAYGHGSYSLAIKGLLPAEKYYVQAYAVNTVGDTGVASQSQTFYTLANEPQGAPDSFGATTSSTTQIDLSFSQAASITHANGYLIIQKQGSIPSGVPSDGQMYSVGTSIGDGVVAAVIYSDIDSQVYITSVSAGNTYYFSIFPLNWDNQNGQTVNYLNNITLTATANTIVVPTLTTSPNYLKVTNDQADLSGAITNTGSQNARVKGICYQIYSNTSVPSVLSDYVSDTGAYGSGNFSFTVESLQAQSRYQYRAFAKNDAGVGYGNTYDFYTLAFEPGAPSKLVATAVSTTQIDLEFDEASNDPVAKGYLIVQKQDTIPTGKPVDGTAYAVGNPLGDGIIAAIITDDEQTVASITSVSAGLTYYFTIYPYNWDATNAQTYNYYSSTVKYDKATTTTAPLITTLSSIQNISNDGADVSGNITNTGGTSISERGICYFEYSPAQDPDTSASKFRDTSGSYSTGMYTKSLSGLKTATHYEFRAYAVNNAGVGYGSSYDFYTLSEEPATHVATFEANVFSTTQIDLTFSPVSSVSNAKGYLIIQSQGSKLTSYPVDATSYSVGNPVGNGTIAAIVTDLSKQKISITNLNAGTSYFYALVPFNWDGSNSETYNYRTLSPVPEDSATTINPCSIDASIEYTGSPVICSGDSLLLTTSDTASGLSYLWTYDGSIISGADSGSLWVQESGDYRVFISNTYCSKPSSIFTLTNYPLVAPKVYADGIIEPCSDDSLRLFTGTYSSYLWNTSDTTNEIYVRYSGQYSVTVIDNYGCSVTSASYTVNASINASPEICIVTVDTSTNQNLIAWEREATTLIDSYYIYKETSKSGEYEKIGTVPYSATSVFVDVNSNPAVKADRYRLSALDTCGIESPLSTIHKTMHLTVNKGIGKELNLIWDHYEGFDFSTYKIYRGASPDSLILIDSIQNNLTSYSDLDPPSGLLYYQVSVVNPDTCYPAFIRAQTTSGPFSQSLSNLKDYNISSLEYLEATPSKQILEKDSGSVAIFEIFTNLDNWDASTTASWLEVYKDLANKKVTVVANSENTDDYERTAKIKVTGTGVDDVTLTLVQSGQVNAIEEELEEPFALKVYPNPYKEYTNIYYELDEPAHVNIQVLDMLGKEVKLIADEQQLPGPFNYRYMPERNNASKGIYFLKLTVNNQTTMVKMLELQ